MFDFSYQRPNVIAEIGCNHMGDLEIAKELILLAKNCGCDVAKFQKRNNQELLTDAQFQAHHPNPWHSYAETYGAHREFLEFNLIQHRELKLYCENVGIVYNTSVWDLTSAHEIISLQPESIKVPSACNNNFDLLKVLRDSFDGDVHISFGMTTHAEEEQVVRFFEETAHAKDRLVVYACTSGYPVSFADVCLLEINRLYSSFGNRVKSIGFSGHHLGIAVDIAAYTLGARWIERHFTKDRAWKGTDHAASLEVPGMQKLVRDLHHLHTSLTYKSKEVLDVELVQRNKLKYQPH
jgi:sialic acid synthase